MQDTSAMRLWSYSGADNAEVAKDHRQANASRKSRSSDRPSAGIGGIAAVAVAKPCRPVVERPVSSNHGAS